MDRRATIIALNDQLRTTFKGGRVQMTPSVYQLDGRLRGRALSVLARYSSSLPTASTIGARLSSPASRSSGASNTAAPRARVFHPIRLTRIGRSGCSRCTPLTMCWRRLPTRVPFFAHIDEFQTFSSDAFASLLSEARKFALHFALANQYCDQLSHAVRSALIGNAGTLVVFRVGSRDAELLAPEFSPVESSALADQQPFTAGLGRGLGQQRIFVEDKLYLPGGMAEVIREQSRQRFGRSRGAIERQRRFQF